MRFLIQAGKIALHLTAPKLHPVSDFQ